MVREYFNNLTVPHNKWDVSNPYFYVRIDSINNHDIQYVRSIAMSAEAAVTWERPSGDWYGPSRGGSAADGDLSWTFDLEAAGPAIIQILTWKRPQVPTTTAGNMTVDLNGTDILVENCHNDWEDWGTRVHTPIVDCLATGNTVTITVPKQAFVAHVMVLPLTRYEGGSGVNKASETRLDILDMNFTKNGVNEVDELTMTVAMKEDYYTDDNPYSGMAFDAWDMITVTMGEDARTAIPMFGGYISGWKLDNDRTELEITALDAIYKLSRTMVWKNFSIGYIPDSTTGRMPFTQFPNVNEIVRYLCSSDYPISYAGIPRDYILYNNFKDSTSVTGLTCEGWTVDWQPEFGNPAPCMRLRPGSLSNSSLVLYTDTIGLWDATVHQMFNMDYYVSGAGVLFPPKFNIEIDMFKTGELYTDADTYVIPFTGPSIPGNKLSTVLPKFDGNWQSLTINLKNEFDKIGGSLNYYIHEIRLVGTPDYNQYLNNKCSSIYIDHIMGYTDVNQAPRYASADSKSPLEELQDLCEKCNQIAYVRPGLERRDDILVMLPKRFYTLPIDIEEGDNLLEVSGLEYRPLDWGLHNASHMTFNYNENQSGTVGYTDSASNLFYDWSLYHEFLSDVNNQEAANAEARNYVEEHKFWYPGFSVKVKGSTLFEPGQYVNVRIPSRRIMGSYEVKSVEYSFDGTTNEFVTDISFNQPHGVFTDFMRQSIKNQRRMKNLESTFGYRAMGLGQGTRNTSAGAYVK